MLGRRWMEVVRGCGMIRDGGVGVGNSGMLGGWRMG